MCGKNNGMWQEYVQKNGVLGAVRDSQSKPVFFVIGPTCSGKSSFAAYLAQQHYGVVINADSMQVYKDLSILTARPSPQEERRVPHALYGVLDGQQKGNVAWWVRAVHAQISSAHEAGRLPILCGGTGMYFHALTHGLSQMPSPSEEVRAQTRSLVAREGSPRVHQWLQEKDPQTAQRIHPSDKQRVIRAWEIVTSSGRGMVWWQKQPGILAANYPLYGVQFEPSREFLREAIEVRFYKMIEHGALEEVEAMAKRHLDPVLPIMRAHGVPELLALIEGKLSREEAFRSSIATTRRYAKRQRTWFAHHHLTSDERMLTFNHAFSPNGGDFAHVQGRFAALFHSIDQQ